MKLHFRVEKKYLLFLLMIVLMVVLIIALYRAVYNYFWWDRDLAEVYFEELCGDESRYGISVYEKVSLSEDYLDRLYDFGARSAEYDTLYIEDGVRLSDSKFNENFIFVFRERSEINPVGPILQHRSYVIRKYDGKLLGESITYVNGTGWFNNIWSVDGGPAKYCEPGQNDVGVSNNNIPHATLIRSIFTINSGVKR
jgi:hypothetical protein